MIPVWDLGNVVFRWDVSMFMETIDLPETTKQIITEQLFCHDIWLEMDRGQQTDKGAIEHLIKLGVAESDVKKALYHARESLVEIEETSALLFSLQAKGVKQYCLSNMSIETYEHICSSRVFDVFNGILISGYEKKMKPDPEIFNLLVDRFQLSRSELLFIDDIEENVRCAMNIGIESFWFNTSDDCYRRLKKLLKVS